MTVAGSATQWKIQKIDKFLCSLSFFNAQCDGSDTTVYKYFMIMIVQHQKLFQKEKSNFF